MKNLLLPLLLLLPLFSLNAQWSATNGPLGGYVYDIEHIGAQLWAGTEGGLYVSDDNGATWTRNALIAGEDQVRTIAVFPGEILLGVTHFNNDGSGSANPEFFSYRSTDGGATFTTSILPVFNWDGIVSAFYRAGNRLYCRADYDWVQSDDDGATWTEIPLPGTMPYANFAAVDGPRMVVADYYSLWKSEDSGANWTFVDSTFYIQSVYLENDLILTETVYGLRRSTDFGLNWQMDSTLQISVENLRRGNQGELWLPSPDGILQSFDDGLSWNLLTLSSAPNEYFSLYDAIQNGAEYIAATSRGVYQTAAGAWTKTNQGLTISKVYALQADQQGGLYASTNVGNFRTADGGANWLPLPAYPYDQGPGAITDWAISGNHILVTDNNDLWHSADQGQSWTNVSPANNALTFADHVILNQGVVFVPNDDNIIYTSDWGATWNTIEIPAAKYGWFDDIVFTGNAAFVITNDGEVYRSTDNFVTWTLVKELYSPGAHNQNRLLFFNNKVYALGRLGVFTSTDNGNTWQEIIPQGVPVDQWGDPFQLTNYLAAGNLLFATISYNGVYLSSDGGVNWQSLNTGLDNLRGRNLALHQQTLYLGTSTGGVYRRNTQFQSVGGTVYEDLNNNGIHDAGEKPLEGVLISTVPLNSFSSTSAAGTYGILADAFSDTLRAIAPTPYATVNPPFYLVGQSGSGLDFGIHFTPGIKDLCVSATNATVIRPGFVSKIVVTAKNIGTAVSAPATVSLVLPAGLSFNFAFPFPVQSGDSLIWSIGALQPFESVNIEVLVDCAVDLTLNQTLSIAAQIDPVDGDENPLNNTYTYREPVVGSYDPNDKQVRPENGITPAQIAQGQRLEYTIRFENTGTYYADFVRILDTLSPLVDVASLEIIAASHPATWTVRGAGVVEFMFKDIFLPPSSWGNGEGYGFVKYAVRCRPGLPLNSAIHNTAHIFFDFNPAITTNTTETRVKEIVATWSAAAAANTFQVWPNPARERLLLHWAQPVSDGVLRLYHPGGQLVLERRLAVSGRQTEVWLPDLPAGHYRLMWADGAHQMEEAVEIIR